MASLPTPTIEQFMKAVCNLPRVEDQITLVTYVVREVGPDKAAKLLLHQDVKEWCKEHSNLFADIARKRISQ